MTDHITRLLVRTGEVLAATMRRDDDHARALLEDLEPDDLLNVALGLASSGAHGLEAAGVDPDDVVDRYALEAAAREAADPDAADVALRELGAGGPDDDTPGTHRP